MTQAMHLVQEQKEEAKKANNSPLELDADAPLPMDQIYVPGRTYGELTQVVLNRNHAVYLTREQHKLERSQAANHTDSSPA